MAHGRRKGVELERRRRRGVVLERRRRRGVVLERRRRRRRRWWCRGALLRSGGVEENGKVGDGEDEAGGRRYERRKGKVGEKEDDMWVLRVCEWLMRFGK
jgi:hypothetical protein